MNRAIQKIEYISNSSLVKKEKDYFVQLQSDEIKSYKFESRKFLRHPIIGFPVFIKDDIIVPCDKYDAQIEGKYHIITFIDCKDEHHLKVHSLTTGLHYTIELRDLRPERK